MRSRAGIAEGFEWQSRCRRKPNSRRLMTNPSVSRCSATACRAISCCRACCNSAASPTDSLLRKPREESVRGGRDAAHLGVSLRVLDGLHHAERHRLRGIDRNLRGRSGKDSELLKCDLNGHRQLADLALIDLRGGIQDDEEGKQERNEIGIGNEPAFMVRVRTRALSPSHEELSSTGFSFVPASTRKPSNLVSRCAGSCLPGSRPRPQASSHG